MNMLMDAPAPTIERLGLRTVIACPVTLERSQACVQWLSICRARMRYAASARFTA